ncbi:MAG: hypothetical protein ACRDTD_26445 [Pseudonocardiaceae bacterium]
MITAARLPKPKLDRLDVFAPEVVVWAYEGPAECALRALLTSGAPAAPGRSHGGLPGAPLPAGAPA